MGLSVFLWGTKSRLKNVKYLDLRQIINPHNFKLPMSGRTWRDVDEQAERLDFRAQSDVLNSQLPRGGFISYAFFLLHSKDLWSSSVISFTCTNLFRSAIFGGFGVSDNKVFLAVYLEIFGFFFFILDYMHWINWSFDFAMINSCQRHKYVMVFVIFRP